MNNARSIGNPLLRTAIAVTVMAIAFDRLFWEQELGLNLTLFALVAMSVSVLVLRRRPSVPALVTLMGLVICAAMVVVHGSIVARVGTIAALAVSGVLLLEPAQRSVPYALLGAGLNGILAPLGIMGVLGQGLKHVPATRSGWRWTRLALIPVAVMLLYFLIYRAANPRFDQLAAGFFGDFFELFWDFMADLFTPHMIFMLFALVACGALLHRFSPHLFTGPQWPLNESLVRERRKRPHWMSPLAMGALDRERRMGVLLLVLVNALLLVVNLVDITWVWFGFEVEEGFDLKQFVHEGTWLLILSILLSMGILLHLFRGNLNFHPKERVLRLLGAAWIAQNFILGISVFMRNYHYISFHGLAYKRIGVVVYLLLVLVGLVTLYLKIRERRTFNYLLRVNGWAAFVVLVGLTTVNWDGLIVRFNLAHWNQGEIDVDNYLAMSDKVLPLVYDDLAKVEAQMARHSGNRVRWVEHLDPAAFRADLNRKRERFLHRFDEQDWRSWTWADQRTYEALKTRGLASIAAPEQPVQQTVDHAQVSSAEAMVVEDDVTVVGPVVEEGQNDPGVDATR